METFARNLRTRIDQLGLTHAEVARRCGLETRRFHHYVVGDREPDLKTLVKIANVLGTTPDKLLGVQPELSVIDDEETRMRARLFATIGTMNGPTLRLLTLLAQGVLTFVRDEAKLGGKPSSEAGLPRRRRNRT